MTTERLTPEQRAKCVLNPECDSTRIVGPSEWHPYRFNIALQIRAHAAQEVAAETAGLRAERDGALRTGDRMQQENVRLREDVKALNLDRKAWDRQREQDIHILRSAQGEALRLRADVERLTRERDAAYALARAVQADNDNLLRRIKPTPEPELARLEREAGEACVELLHLRLKVWSAADRYADVNATFPSNAWANATGAVVNLDAARAKAAQDGDEARVVEVAMGGVVGDLIEGKYHETWRIALRALYRAGMLRAPGGAA